MLDSFTFLLALNCSFLLSVPFLAASSVQNANSNQQTSYCSVPSVHFLVTFQLHSQTHNPFCVWPYPLLRLRHLFKFLYREPHMSRLPSVGSSSKLLDILQIVFKLSSSCKYIVYFYLCSYSLSLIIFLHLILYL